MKSSSIVFAAAVLAQTEIKSEEQISPVVKCLEDNKCNGDVECAAKCVGVPNPSHDLAESTAKCFNDCKPSEGQIDAEKYAACTAKCIESFSNHNGSGNSNSNSASGNGNASKSGSKSGSASASGSNAESFALSYQVVNPIVSVFFAGAAAYAL